MLKRCLAPTVMLGLFLSVSLSSASTGTLQIKQLKGAAPSWWTPQLRAQVAAAGPAGVPLPAEAKATIPASSLAFVGIRPGALILVETAGGTALCSTNFVFSTGGSTTSLLGAPSTSMKTAAKSGSGKAQSKPSGKGQGKGSATGGSYYIGTAGHCGKVGDTVSIVALPFGIATLGTIVKSTAPPEGGNNTSALDFALVSVDPALNQWVSPSMAHWGGPTGVFTGSGIQPIQHSGWGLVVGTGGTPRAGVAYAWNVGNEYRFEGLITPGDSGSGAIVAGGLAAGNVTHIAVDTSQTPPVWNGGSTMTAILKYLGTSYQLATCSLPVPWPAPGCPPV